MFNQYPIAGGGYTGIGQKPPQWNPTGNYGPQNDGKVHYGTLYNAGYSTSGSGGGSNGTSAWPGRPGIIASPALLAPPGAPASNPYSPNGGDWTNVDYQHWMQTHPSGGSGAPSMGGLGQGGGVPIYGGYDSNTGSNNVLGYGLGGQQQTPNYASMFAGQGTASDGPRNAYNTLLGNPMANMARNDPSLFNMMANGQIAPTMSNIGSFASLHGDPTTPSGMAMGAGSAPPENFGMAAQAPVQRWNNPYSGGTSAQYPGGIPGAAARAAKTGLGSSNSNVWGA